MTKYVKEKEDFTIVSRESGELKKWNDFWEKLAIRSDIEAICEMEVVDRAKALSTADEDWLVYFYIQKSPVFTLSPSVFIEGELWMHWYSHWMDWRFISTTGIDFIERDTANLQFTLGWIDEDNEIVYETTWDKLSENEKHIVYKIFCKQFKRKINEFIKENRTKFFEFLAPI